MYKVYVCEVQVIRLWVGLRVKFVCDLGDIKKN